MGIKGFKGFNPDMTCSGKQYEENTIFSEAEAVVCKKGMHFCTNPFDVLDYYPILNKECKFNVFVYVTHTRLYFGIFSVFINSIFSRIDCAFAIFLDLPKSHTDRIQLKHWYSIYDLNIYRCILKLHYFVHKLYFLSD